jgi:hypothetical protein
MARGLRLGIAVGPARAVATVLGPNQALFASEPLHLSDDNSSAAAELFRVFVRLAERLEEVGAGPTDDAQIHLSLLPPLADTRLVEFPPLRQEELMAVLRRDVARYFLGGVGPQVVGVHTGRRGSNGGGGQPVLVAAAALSLLEAASEAAVQIGWSLESVGPAQGAWLSAAGDAGSKARRAIIAIEGPTAYLMRLEGGVAVAVRQVPSSDLPGVAEALGDGPGRVLVLGPHGAEQVLADRCSSAGWVVDPVPGGVAGRSDPLEVAAMWADRSVLELVPPTLVARRDSRRRLKAVRLGIAAAALVVAAGGAKLWGTHRELDAVRADRLEIADRVEPLILARDSLQRLRDRIQATEDLWAHTPRWTPVLVELASLLPSDSHLTALFASGDTIELEAAGSRAGEAIQALRAAGLFQDVRLQGVVERELENGETVVERFRVGARLADVAPERRGGLE